MSHQGAAAAVGCVDTILVCVAYDGVRPGLSDRGYGLIAPSLVLLASCGAFRLIGVVMTIPWSHYQILDRFALTARPIESLMPSEPGWNGASSISRRG